MDESQIASAGRSTERPATVETTPRAAATVGEAKGETTRAMLEDMMQTLRQQGADVVFGRAQEIGGQTIVPVAKSQQAAALSFLMGEGELTSSFDFRVLDSSQMGFEGGWVLEGTPKEATPAYQKILLYVDAATAQVRRVLILDAQGNRNRFDFDNPLVNTPVAPTEFNFTPPAGTQIVKP